MQKLSDSAREFWKHTRVKTGNPIPNSVPLPPFKLLTNSLTSPLHIAIESGNSQIAQQLIQQSNSDPFDFSPEGLTPIAAAIKNNNRPLSKLAIS